jgi:hypothetical protein
MHARSRSQARPNLNSNDSRGRSAGRSGGRFKGPTAANCSHRASLTKHGASNTHHDSASRCSAQEQPGAPRDRGKGDVSRRNGPEGSIAGLGIPRIVIETFTSPNCSRAFHTQRDMRRFLTALLAYISQDDAHVLRALGDPDRHGLSRLKEICESDFTCQVRNLRVYIRIACKLNL